MARLSHNTVVQILDELHRGAVIRWSAAWKIDPVTG